MMKYLILIIFLIYSSFCNAQTKEWTDTDKILFTASTVALTLDWASTRNMTRRYNEGYEERNIILGKHPSRTRIDLHFMFFIPLNYFIADYAGENRPYYLTAITLVELMAIQNNKRVGLHFTF